MVEWIKFHWFMSACLTCDLKSILILYKKNLVNIVTDDAKKYQKSNYLPCFSAAHETNQWQWSFPSLDGIAKLHQLLLRPAVHRCPFAQCTVFWGPYWDLREGHLVTRRAVPKNGYNAVKYNSNNQSFDLTWASCCPPPLRCWAYFVTHQRSFNGATLRVDPAHNSLIIISKPMTTHATHRLEKNLPTEFGISFSHGSFGTVRIVRI